MNLAKSIVAIAFLLLALPYAHAANASLGGSLSVSGLQYLPSPALPGQYIEVYINVQNNRVQVDSVLCELRPEYPFSLDANENAERQIGTLGAGQNFVLKYKVRVDPSSVLGDNNLKVACKTRDTGWIEAKIPISVQSQARSLVIQQIILDPEEIEPGSQGTITLHVNNIATTPVRDVSVKLDLTSETLPFAPIESATEKNIPFIGGSQEYDVSFKLVSFADAQPNAYKIPVKISFKDYLGNAYTLNDTIGVILNSKPVLEAFVDESKIIRENSGGIVLVKIINRGLSDAKFLNAIAKDSATVQVVEPKAFYVGNLGSDDFDTIEYKLFITKAENNRASFPLELTYRDANNNQYSQEAVVELRLYSEDEISRLGLEAKQGVNWFVILVIAAIAFGAYWFFVRKKMKIG